MGELGDRLRQAREAKGLTLEEVEEATKIRRRFLRALEEEDYTQLPGEVFIRGFLRNYALALGLDPEEILAASGRKTASLVEAEGLGQPVDEPLVPSASTGQRVLAVLFGIMFVIALGLGTWTLYRYMGPPGTPPNPWTPDAIGSKEAPTATPSPTQTPQPTATPSPTDVPPTEVPALGVLLRLEATQKAWVLIIVDGHLDYEGNLEAGQIKETQGAEQIFLRTGNAGGLRVWYNGQEQEPLGAVGAVVEQTWKAGALPTPGPPGEPTGESTPEPLGPPPNEEQPTAAPNP